MPGVIRPRTLSQARVAVVGAGVAGLACARELAARGAKVHLFEATRGIGGRLASLTTAAGTFDPGAQYFTVQHHRFEVAVEEWVAGGVAARWNGRFVGLGSGRTEPIRDSLPRFVGVPSMGAVAMRMARGLEIQLETPIARVRRVAGGWRLFDPRGAELGIRPHDAVVIATPAPVAVELLQEHGEFARLARSVVWEPTITALLALDRGAGAPFDAAFLNGDPLLGWAALDSSKPGRVAHGGERWVLHSRPAWARGCFELDEHAIFDRMQQAFAARLGRPLDGASPSIVRYRYATPVNALARTFLWDGAARIGAAGDWCGGPRVEAAFLSGVGLAEAMAG